MFLKGKSKTSKQIGLLKKKKKSKTSMYVKKEQCFTTLNKMDCCPKKIGFHI